MFILQAAIILSPIWLYQLLLSRRTFRGLPKKKAFIGIYGGIIGVIDTWFPIHILGVVDSFQVIPVILSIIYGNRKAGTIAFAMTMIYNFIVHPMNWGVQFSMTVCICAIPFIIGYRYDGATYLKRIFWLGAIGVVTVFVELAFGIAFQWFQTRSWTSISHLFTRFDVAMSAQLVLMWLILLVMEQICEDERMRKRLEESQQNLVVSQERHFGLVTDVAHQRKAEECMMKSEMLATVGQLAAGVAHEIRNPLTSLKGFLALLESETEDKSPYFGIMQEELSRINIISTQLLALASPQVDTFRPKDMNGIIQDVVSLMNSEALISNVIIVTELNVPLDLVLGDEVQLKQILINLIKNSMDAMVDGGKITIKSCRDSGRIRVTIQDEGCGMNAETLSRLGEPFYTTKTSGTGLGLMVTYRLLERHNATIQYESELGHGTLVTLVIPYAPKTFHDA